MSIWALADLHLSFGTKGKTMEVFGDLWKGYVEKIRNNWEEKISKDDLVLLPGDLSWAFKTEEVMLDLEWIDKLPGTKLLIKGNHDHWWSSKGKLEKILPETLHLLQNDAFFWRGVAIGGTRLWDDSSFNFDDFVVYKPFSKQKEKAFSKEESEKIFLRELLRLEKSLSLMNPEAVFRIAMTHFPPIGADLKPSSASAILEKFHVDVCVFGHLHSIQEGKRLFGEKKNGVLYELTSCDYRAFCPLKIFSLP